MPVQHRRRIWPRQVAFGDDALRVAGLVRKGLQPSGLVDRIGRIDRGLDVYGLDHIGETDLRKIVLDAIALRFQWIGIGQKTVHGIGLQPAVAQGGVLQVVQVEVCVDEGKFRHGCP
jgi:hypothetical protein